MTSKISLNGGIIIVLILMITGMLGSMFFSVKNNKIQYPIPELSAKIQALSDSYVDQLNQEIRIARQQGFLAQQQTKVEFLTSVVEQGSKFLEDEATPDEKISIGGAKYLREEVETDLQSRQERLETSATQIDSTQRAIGRMQDALSNLKNLTQFDVNSISGEEALRAQLVAFHNVGQLPWPTLKKRESVEDAVKKVRADFDHRLDLLGQSSSPDLGDLFASMEESSVSNFHWREELGLNDQELVVDDSLYAMIPSDEIPDKPSIFKGKKGFVVPPGNYLYEKTTDEWFIRVKVWPVEWDEVDQEGVVIPLNDPTGAEAFLRVFDPNIDNSIPNIQLPDEEIFLSSLVNGHRYEIKKVRRKIRERRTSIRERGDLQQAGVRKRLGTPEF